MTDLVTKFVLLASILWQCWSASASQGALRVGVGKTVITPDHDQWLAGYAARTAPSTGKIHDLYAKALAFALDFGIDGMVIGRVT